RKENNMYVEVLEKLTKENKEK
ncbi:MAG: hypothetical protein QG583_159, partial [Patescibacteria group bacterium]|nr:hypothetical protein [Patescibacteria group bacterium]